ncbi:MAG: methyltransferase domain-containing protein [Anaerolineales bacterium]|nr:methyltransferase domain-containing protein [Anaerolineales bacterium]
MSFTQSTRYQRCQAIFDRAYPDFRNAGQRYHDHIAAIIQPTSRVLDVGCGRMSLAAEALQQAQHLIGIDLVHEDLQHNPLVHGAAVATANHLPFTNGSFDVVVSQWVVEHFEQPRDAFREMSRVLRPGGHLVFLTTNANNYIPLVSRLVPDRLQKTLIQRLLRRPRHESFPTFYRANTRRAVQRLASESGLQIKEVDYIANPFYLAFNVGTFRLALAYEKLTDWRPLNALKLYLLAILYKPE